MSEKSTLTGFDRLPITFVDMYATYALSIISGTQNKGLIATKFLTWKLLEKVKFS